MTTADPGNRTADGGPGPTTSTELDQLRLEVRPGAMATVIGLEGELDPHTAPLVQRELDAAIGSGATRVVLDLAGLRFIDSSGLRVIISAHRRLTASGGTFALAHPSDTTRRLLEITGLDAHFEIVDAP